MYSREEIKQLHKEFWNGFDELPEAMERSVTDKANIVKAAIRISGE